MLKDLLQGKPLRHPIHPMLVHFPIGFFVLSLLLDLISLASPAIPNLMQISFYAMLSGTITALFAAVPGFVDYSDIRDDHPAKRVATAHMILNLMVVAIYGINLGVRSSLLYDPKVHAVPLALSLIGAAFLSISGYLGGRLVYDEGIAVGRHKRLTLTPQETIELSRTEAGFVLVPQAERLRDQETLRVAIEDCVLTIARIGTELL